jgi:hypothetical protein
LGDREVIADSAAGEAAASLIVSRPEPAAETGSPTSAAGAADIAAAETDPRSLLASDASDSPGELQLDPPAVGAPGIAATEMDPMPLPPSDASDSPGELQLDPLAALKAMTDEERIALFA